MTTPYKGTTPPSAHDFLYIDLCHCYLLLNLVGIVAPQSLLIRSAHIFIKFCVFLAMVTLPELYVNFVA